ncbi:hypothetical protein NPIL_225701 [Nephila pilipes]|uniref:Uncharacterized protein n=1 Tax=Nephila pilipes TaxID=299642 RepID=A0A8X6QMS0_NEPPI|nr:hypothetical protein NPIL_225701 [Nephila pilipes]
MESDHNSYTGTIVMFHGQSNDSVMEKTTKPIVLSRQFEDFVELQGVGIQRFYQTNLYEKNCLNGLAFIVALTANLYDASSW